MKIHSFSFALVLTFLLFAVPATAQKAVRDVTGDLANQRNTLSFSAVTATLPVKSLVKVAADCTMVLM